MNGFLLDTNVISEVLKPLPEPRVLDWMRSLNESLLFLSVLTVGEIRKGIDLQQSPAKRTQIEAWLQNQIRSRFAGRILPVDQNIAERWGTLTAKGRLAGSPLPIIDGLLAATALRHELVLTTRNARDVASTGVQVFNPWHTE